MPKFVVRLESPELMREDGSPHIRVTRMEAADDEEARRVCERRELQIAAHEYPPQVLEDLERQEAEAASAGSRAPAQVRMQLATHRQREPYGVVSVEEVT